MDSNETVHELRVRFAETDQMGVAHHSAWIVWLEEARVEWLRERGLSYRELEDSGTSLAVSEVQVRYRSAARFDDLIQIRARLEESRSRSFRFSYTVIRTSDGTLLADAVTRHTPVDRDGRAVRMRQDWLERISG